MNFILVSALLLVLSGPVYAGESVHEGSEHDAGKRPGPEAISGGRVAAVNVKSAKPVHEGDLIQSGTSTFSLVDGENTRIELAPHSVAEFRPGQGFHLLRGSACLESRGESTARTGGSVINYVGRAVISYDYKDKSTSAFVLEGQARVSNEADSSRSLRLDRFRGATMVAGDVIPQLVRQLDVGALDSWLKGYAWPEAKRRDWLSGVPGEKLAVRPTVAEHLEEAKLENYFSAIDNDDEVQAPDYYDRKFADPDKAIAEANSVKAKGADLRPEEAALISLPDTKIDLGFELAPQAITLKQKQAEGAGAAGARKAPARSLASVSAQPTKGGKAKASSSDQVDPDVRGVLSRLRALRDEASSESSRAETSQKTGTARQPASVGIDPVPDTVYDYSQNF